MKTENYSDAVQRLLNFGATAAVVTCGEKGSCGADQTGVYYQKMFKVPVVDTTGAGDVFHGAFVSGLIKKYTLPEILKFANAAAAIKCQQIGGRQGIPDFKTVMRFMQSYRDVK